VGAPTATRALTACSYLTDETRLVYVLELKYGQVVIEDARTLDVTIVREHRLDGWRFVTPEVANAC
jgi:hypothetical protein